MESGASSTNCRRDRNRGTAARPVTLARALRARFEAAGVKTTYDPAVPLVTGFREGGRPFADGVLFADEKRASSGLARELFTSKDFTGSPIDARLDSQIDFYWTAAQPIPGLPLENVNLRWTGVLIPAKSGTHDLAITFIGAAQLFVDDKAVSIDVPLWLLRRWDDSANRYVVDPMAWSLAAGPASDRPLLQAEIRVQAD